MVDFQIFRFDDDQVSDLTKIFDPARSSKS